MNPVKIMKKCQRKSVRIILENNGLNSSISPATILTNGASNHAMKLQALEKSQDQDYPRNLKTSRSSKSLTTQADAANKVSIGLIKKRTLKIYVAEEIFKNLCTYPSKWLFTKSNNA